VEASGARVTSSPISFFNDDEISLADKSGLFRPYAAGNKTAVSLSLVIIRALVTEQITGLQFTSEMKEIAHAGQPASIILVPLELKRCAHV
jgi:hypothetical protein